MSNSHTSPAQGKDLRVSLCLLVHLLFVLLALNIKTSCFFKSEAPDRYGDDGGWRAVPQNQSAQALY